MGSCLSKKTSNSSSPSPLQDHPPIVINSNTEPQKEKPKKEILLNQETFIIQRKKSHEFHRQPEEENHPCKAKITPIEQQSENNTSSHNGSTGIAITATIRTSSCTKEEVEAILIQCGRLSHSSSFTGKPPVSGSGGSCNTTASLQRAKKYSGSKGSYDFDNEICDKDNNGHVIDGDEAIADKPHRPRQQHRQSRTAGSSPHGRRRTPSRERDQQRSGSRERSSSGAGGRRVSRSPGRRSESPITTSNGVSGTTSGNSNNNNARPGKMVSVPATVPSLATDKSNNGCGGMAESPSTAAAKRIQAKRNVAESVVGSRRDASPHSHSPARTNVNPSNEIQNAHGHPSQHQQQSLSSSNSRKVEQSPYRINPLSEIDTNVIVCEQSAHPSNKATSNNSQHQVRTQKLGAENENNNKVVQGTDTKSIINRGTLEESQQRQPVVEAKVLQTMILNVAGSGSKSQNLTRSRSSRLSRDLDINPGTLLNPNPSYTALLLEDIQNFHQHNAPTPAFSLPPCLTKACSILEAVTDLNTRTSSHLSSAFAEESIRNPKTEQFNKNENNPSLGVDPAAKKRLDTKDPIVESEIIVNNDLMEPSFHKYVSVRRGAFGEGDMVEQESSGSFVGDQQHWLSSSSREPNSAYSTYSTDCWTSSRSNDSSSLGFQRQAFYKSSCHLDEPHGRLSEKKRASDNVQAGIGRGRGASSRGSCTMPIAAAAAAST